MIIQEILYLTELLGKERPDVRRMVQKVRLHPEEAHVIRKHMLFRLRKMGFDLSDLPAFGSGPEEAISDDGIFAGDIIFGEKIRRKLLVPLDSFAEHTLVAGHSGSGKSFLIRMLVPQFVAKGISVWIFDSENEYRVLLKRVSPKNVVILSPKTDRDNFLEPPPGVSPKEWLAKLKNLFRESFYLRDGSINLLDNLILNLYKNKGVLDGGKDYPCLPDLLSLLEMIEFKPATRFSAYHESLVNRFRGLGGELGEVLSCKKGYEIGRFSEGIVIYESRGLSDYLRNFYVNLKTLRLSSYYENLPPRNLRTIVVIEEAHKLFPEKSSRYDLGEPMIFGSARTFRKRGIGFVYSDQVPSELPAALSGNVNNRFVMRLTNGKCIWRISQVMNLKPEQSECLPVIPKRQCIFQSADYPEPVLGEIPRLSFEHVSDEEVSRHMEKLLPELEYTPVEDKAEMASEGMERPGFPGEKRRSSRSRPNRLWKEIIEILVEVQYIALTPLAANHENISPWHLRKVLNQMERQGMIELCQVNLGTRGNPKTYVTLRPKGAEFVGVNYDDVRLPGKGSTEHAILQNLLAEAMKDSGKTVEVEYHVNGKSVDIAEHDNHRSTAHEIELEPSHSHVAENITKDLEAGFDEVVIITRNQIGQNEAKNLIYKMISWERISKVNFRLIREFL